MSFHSVWCLLNLWKFVFHNKLNMQKTLLYIAELLKVLVNHHIKQYHFAIIFEIKDLESSNLL